MKRKIGIVDADIINIIKRPRQFPNLACMKLSGYHKAKGDDVKLLLNYNQLDAYDRIYISKVFTETIIPSTNPFFEVPILERSNVQYGGTGFFFDKAEPLPYEIEHHMPDYHLYDDWVKLEVDRGKKISRLKYFTSFSIGFMTRGCFRGCEFCVNRNKTRVEFHAHLKEFLDPTLKGISLLDDNILGYPRWREVFDELIASNKPFEFKQGMDIRLLTKEKAKVISSCRYHGNYIFAFDNIEDKELIIKKLQIWREIVEPRTRTVLYVLCGFDKTGKYNDVFWRQDLINMWEKIKILMTYGCAPYIMRFNKCEGPDKEFYSLVRGWCNTVHNFIGKSFREYCEHPAKDANVNYMPRFREIEKKYPEIAKKYFDLKFEREVIDRGWW